MDKTANIGLIVGAALLAVGTYFLLKDRKQQTNNIDIDMDNNNIKIPRGYRNNNPLNIKINSKNNWQGKILPNTDGTYEQFKSIEYGYRAALVLLRNYIKDGDNTVAAIISRWAPANENNTTGYINRVCSTTGFVPGTVIAYNDKNALCKLVYAMAIVENGVFPNQPVMAEIEKGWSML